MFQLDQTNQLILMHLSNGLTSKEISDKICLAERTVINRIVEMMEETHTKNRTELVFYYSDKIKQMREDEQKAA
jgi:DNA-binding NarL/FixJ family response regulator